MFSNNKLSLSRRSKSGFTLVELMVVIAILVVLLSMISVGFRGALASARGIQCQQNLRQIGAGFMGFAADHDGFFPKAWWNHGPVGT